LSDRDTRIEHVVVNNPSMSLNYPLGDFDPCIIIASAGQMPPIIVVGNSDYGPVLSVPAGEDMITIFFKINSLEK
jgi:hypothetical protein